MQMLSIPDNYDVWFTGFKLYLDRTPGSKADLARYLERVLAIKFTSAQVKVAHLLARKYIPSAETFLDIASWLQRQVEARNDPPIFRPLPPPEDSGPIPARRPVTYTTGGQPEARVAETPP
jgi:hypothetical protein